MSWTCLFNCSNVPGEVEYLMHGKVQEVRELLKLNTVSL